MKWYQSRYMYWHGLLGVLMGSVVLYFGTMAQLQWHGLSQTWQSYVQLHTMDVSSFLLDLSPLVFGLILGLLGWLRHQASLIASAKREWETIFDNFSDPLFVLDEQNKIQRCNRSVIQKLGMTFQEVIGQPLQKFTGETFLTELRAGKAEVFWQNRLFTVTAFPIETAKQPSLLSVYILRDVTERKQMEETLVIERNMLRSLIDNLPDSIYIKDMQGRRILVNAADAAMHGKTSPADMLGKTSLDLYPKDIADLIDAEDRTIFETEHPMLNHEFHGQDAHGNPIWVLISKVPVRDAHEQIVGLVGIARDNTQQKKNELEIKRQKQFYETLISTSPAAVVVLDTDEKIISCNPAFERLFGYKAEEAHGQALDILITTEEARAEAEEYTRQVMQGAVHFIQKRRRKDGNFVDVEISGVPVFVEGERVGALATYHDISDIVRARREAEEANRAKSEFLANMSHEIRTPMNGVIGMLELALDTSLTTEQQDYLNTSLKSAESLLSLLNDILDFSKIEAKKLELEAINFNLRNTIEDVGYTLAKRAQDKGLELICLIGSTITHNLTGDAGRLRQVLINLTGNAIKFTHQGEIVIRAELLEETETHARIHFSVQDTGIGIPPERQNAVFERFTQVDGTTTRKYGGSGLGLTISKQLIEAMHGVIGLQSEPGVGSNFWFEISFPIASAIPALLLPVTGDALSLNHIRILSIDDNQTNRYVLTKMVEGFGCLVHSAESGEQGLHMLQNAAKTGQPYDIVLLDMQMPAMDGEQTARLIKSDPHISNVKIIVLTSMGQRGDAARMEELGCSGYLLKPIKQKMLYETLFTVLNLKEKEKPLLITRHVISEKQILDRRILLAEDNDINQKIALAFLQRKGYSVDVVHDGAQAVEKALAFNYGLILMDVQMPELDGYEATRRIRLWETQNNRHIPIIAMTAHAMKGDREKCLAAGMDDYLTKPINSKELYSLLDHWLANPEDPQPLPHVNAFILDDLEEGLFGEDTPAASDLKEEFALPFELGTPPNPPVNLPGAIEIFDGDEEFMFEMARTFRDHLPNRITDIYAALHEQDFNRLCRHAHSLKGVALNFSAQYLAEIAAHLEHLCQFENLKPIPLLVLALEKEASRVKEYLQNTL